MPRVSFAVQAHPARAALAAALAEQISADVVLDPDPDNPIRSPWRTYRHLLQTAPRWATHRFQIQDDAIACPGLHHAVEQAVAARPDRLLIFYVGGAPWHHARSVLEACQRDEPWAVLDYAHWIPVVATCWPVTLAHDLLTYVDEQRWPEKYTADDEIIGRYVRDRKHRPLASVPSLVEHPDEEPSLIGTRTRQGRDPSRVAACYIGNCSECVEGIDWTAGPD